ncbi:MAG: hypothetical protein S4CHLAM6_02070 [Chlamydiae bacterium]|nr:hypothetical protein [Chlamydiota bacterium]
MQITYVYNACVLVEHNGSKILCDPWLIDGIYYGSWHQYPKAKAAPKDFFDVDYIYISHIHPDHLDPATLKLFPKEIPIIICNYAHKFVFNILKKIGFKKIIELRQAQPHKISKDFQIEVIAADFCDPTLCQKHFACAPQSTSNFQTQQIDSLAIFSTPDETLVNLNDVPYLLAQKALIYINENYPKIDCALIGYSGAGPYPQCFEHLSTNEKKLKAALKLKQFMNQSIAFLKKLKPSYFMPFAGQYVLGGSLHQLNEMRGVPQIEELPSLFDFYLNKHNVESKFFMLNSMEHFNLQTHRCSKKFIAPDPLKRKKYILEILSKRPLDYENYSYDTTELKESIHQAYKHLLKYQKTWNYSPKQNLYIDYGAPEFLCLPYETKKLSYVRDLVEPYVKITLDPRLFFQILNKKAHWNNAEIGSHLTFKRSPDIFDRSMYLTLSYFHV